MKRSASLVLGVALLAITLLGCQSSKSSKSELSRNQATNLPPVTAHGGPTNVVDASTNSVKTNEVELIDIEPSHKEKIILREGDVVKLTVPSTPTLDGSHVIRRDGNITLDMIGEIRAAGKNIPALKGDLLKAFADKIDTKEISVELESGKFPVFITGAVLRPGRVDTDHPLTALEAIMECGGFDLGHANMRSIKVSRLENGKYKSFKINLKAELEGRISDPFYLQPQDIVYVPERFVWF